jgi:hypothetical protein
VPGTQSHSTVPDLSEIEALGDIAPGVLTWSVQAVRVPGFVFDELKYALLASRYFSHTSIDSFVMRR